MIGAVAGVALLAAAIFFACRKSRRKQAINVPPLFAEAPPSAAMHEMGAATQYARLLELPGQSGLAPGELQGDAPAVNLRGVAR